MNRADLQHLADERVRDAEALLNAGRWSGAYYLAGYAVECGLKACIAKLTKEFDFPEKDRVLKSYTHNIDGLVALAGFKTEKEADGIASPALGLSWEVVKDWGESARYQVWTEAAARKMVAAVANPANGVLPWIKARW